MEMNTLSGVVILFLPPTVPELPNFPSVLSKVPPPGYRQSLL